MKRIWIVTHFCSDFESKGNNRFNYLAKLLADRGYQVEFITSDFSHVKKKPRTADAADPAYHVSLVHEPGYQKNVSIRRLRSHKVFGQNLKLLFAQLEKPQVVYLAVPSLDAGKVTTEYCQANNIPLVIDVQDLWPEAFCIAAKRFFIPEWVFTPMKKTADYIYKNADAVVSVSNTYLDRANLVRKKQGGQCVFIGTNLSVFDSYPDAPIKKPDGEIWIAYVGTLGSSYDLRTAIEAMRILVNKGLTGFRFKVFGDGPDMQQLIEQAQGLPIDFSGRVLYQDLAGLIRKCDIAVNPLVKGAAQSIINKHADYAAAGLPVVSTQECPEYRKLLETYGCGINCPPEDASSVADALEKLLKDPQLRKEMRQRSRQMAEGCFDRATTYQQIVTIIEELAR